MPALRLLTPGFGLFVLLASPLGLKAQENARCNCGEVFEFVASYTERNYAGFADKVPSTRRAEYDALRAQLAQRAVRVHDNSACHAVLNDYIAFFRDRHMGVTLTTASGSEGAGSDAAIRARFAAWPARMVSEAEYRLRVGKGAMRANSLEGIWEIVGANYRMAMVAADGPGSWEAVILKSDSVWWVPGQVKGRFRETSPGEFEAETYLRDHTPVRSTARLRGGILTLSNGSPWVRVWPDNPSGYERARYDASANREFAVRELDAQTVLLQLPTFSGSQAERIDSLIQANWQRLTKAPNLIIDVRGNGGGADRSFRSLRPLLYTGPVVNTGLALYATEDNIRSLVQMLEQRSIPADMKPRADSMIAEARARLGEFLVHPPDTFRLDSVLPMPRRVAVLTDRSCASSCEAFVFVALQSDKVTVYGENTGGLLDYGNVVSVATSCPAFRLRNPTSRSNHLSQQRSYDLVGIPPEVRIPDDVVYALEWVRTQLRNED